MLKSKYIVIFLSCFGLLSGCSGGSTSTATSAQGSKAGAQGTSSNTLVTRQENNSFHIETASDDAYENQTDGTVSLSSNTISLGSNGLVGLRFNNIDIPKNATVARAYIQFSAHKDLSSDSKTTLQIQIEDSENSTAFSAQNQNLSNRNRLAKTIDWAAHSQWGTINERSTHQRTPNLAPLLQNIISKEGWKPGNAVSLFLTGQGLHNINSYEESMNVLQVNDLSANLVIHLSKVSTFTSSIGNDDAEESLETGYVDTNSSDLELGWETNVEASAQRVGIRFTNINITPKSKIHKAYIQFTQDENKNANPFAVTIRTENSANPSSFSNKNKNLTNRSTSQTQVMWSSNETWGKLHESGKNQQTPNLKKLLQERVNDPQWKTGNAMAFFIEGIGTRTAETFESGPTLAPKLVVEYTNESAPFVFDKIRLVWRDDPTSTISIIWNQNEGDKGVVYYDEYKNGECPKDPSKYALSKSHDKYTSEIVYQMRTVTTRLTGLKPDTDYRFIIKNDSGISECSWFKTAPNTPKPFHYISGGDTKSSGTSLKIGRWSNKMVSKVRPLFVFFTGDFNSGIGLDPDSWKQWLTDWSTLTRSKDGRMYPLIVAHGNHESGNFEVLYQLFDTGNSNEFEAIKFAYNAYSFGGNLLHLVSLNSEITRPWVLPIDPQTLWLRRTLEKAKGHSLRVVGYHKPMRPHTSKKSEAIFIASNWAPIFEQYGIHVAYESDTHNHAFTYPIRPAKIGENGEEGFIRDDEKGTMHVGEGSWGAGPRRTDDDKGWTLESQAINQIKLNRVYPSTANSPARLDISVIKIADRNSEGKLVNYVEGVREANDDTPMVPPLGVTLHSTPGFGETVSVPFSANTP